MPIPGQESYREYQLMHRDVEVATVAIDELTGVILSVLDVANPAHLPVGVAIRWSAVDRAALNNWWIGRSIPASRSGLRHFLDELGISATHELVLKCLGLSLSDHYWIRPAGEDLLWKDVNFYENDFSEDVGNILFGGTVTGNVDLVSPDNTSDGWLKKKWVMRDRVRHLVKGGSGMVSQEPYNEVIASRVMERLGIEHVEYALTLIGGYPHCVCPNFTTERTEFVPATRILMTKRKPNHVSQFRHYLDCLSSLGVPDARGAVEKQIVVDWLLLNEDRHFGNFGVLRDSETLEWLTPAPVFDTGSSLWYTTLTPMIAPFPVVKCKPFKEKPDDQLALVEDFSWLDCAKLTSLGDMALEVFEGSVFVEKDRAEAIANALDMRAEKLASIVRGRG